MSDTPSMVWDVCRLSVCLLLFFTQAGAIIDTSETCTGLDDDASIPIAHYGFQKDFAFADSRGLYAGVPRFQTSLNDIVVMSRRDNATKRAGSRYARFSGKGVVLAEPRLRANGLHGADISDWTLEAWVRFDFSDEGAPAPPQGVVSFQSTQDRTYFGIALSAGPDRFLIPTSEDEQGFGHPKAVNRTVTCEIVSKAMHGCGEFRRGSQRLTPEARVCEDKYLTWSCNRLALDAKMNFTGQTAQNTYLSRCKRRLLGLPQTSWITSCERNANNAKVKTGSDAWSNFMHACEYRHRRPATPNNQKECWRVESDGGACQIRPSNRFQHIAVTYNRWGIITLYLNGRKYRQSFALERRRRRAPWARKHTAIILGGARVDISTNKTAGATLDKVTHQYRGDLRDVRAFDQALSEEQLQLSYITYKCCVRCPSTEPEATICCDRIRDRFKEDKWCEPLVVRDEFGQRAFA